MPAEPHGLLVAAQQLLQHRPEYLHLAIEPAVDVADRADAAITAFASALMSFHSVICVPRQVSTTSCSLRNRYAWAPSLSNNLASGKPNRDGRPLGFRLVVVGDQRQLGHHQRTLQKSQLGQGGRGHLNTTGAELRPGLG